MGRALPVADDGKGNLREAVPYESPYGSNAAFAGASLGARACPTAYARLILKRAGIAPLAIGIAAGALASSASAQQTSGARVTALAQARAVIVSNSVRVGRNAEPSQAAGTAGRGATALPADVRVSVQPCDPSQRGAASEPRRLCQLRITNIP